MAREVDAMVDQLRALEEQQRQDADPTHEDFYAWGGALDQITHRLAEVCRTLGWQIARYGDRRILRDDEGLDPSERLGEMRELLNLLVGELEEAGKTARAFHASASHVAVEVDPNL